MTQTESAILITMAGTNESGDEVVLSTSGLLAQSGKDSFVLRFEEMGDGGPVLTILDCEGQHVTIVRAGSTASAMSFRQGVPYESRYETPVGPLVLRIYPTEVTVRRRGLTGQIHLAYQVSMGGLLAPSRDASLRRLAFRFRPCAR